jgi:hypothetical protein
MVKFSFLPLVFCGEVYFGIEALSSTLNLNVTAVNVSQTRGVHSVFICMMRFGSCTGNHHILCSYER